MALTSVFKWLAGAIAALATKAKKPAKPRYVYTVSQHTYREKNKKGHWVDRPFRHRTKIDRNKYSGAYIRDWYKKWGARKGKIFSPVGYKPWALRRRA